MSARSFRLLLAVACAVLGLLVFVARSTNESSDAHAPGATPASVPHRTPSVEAAPSERQPLAAEPDSALAAVETPASGGQLRFLDVATLVGPPATRWMLHGATGAATVDLAVPAGGLVSVPAGTWRLENVGDGWVAVEARVTVFEGVTETVWVARAEPFRVRVLSMLGGPIAGAAVLWIPNTSPPEAGLVTRTDAEGVATIAADLRGPGRCIVSARGFASETIGLLPDPALEVRVLLGPASASPIVVRVVDAETDVPRSGLEALSERGYVGTTDEHGEIEVPADAEGLTLRGEGVFPTLFHAAALAEGVLRVPRRSRVALRLETRDGAPSSGVVFLMLLEAPPPCNGSVVLAKDGREASDSGGVALALPAGAVVEVLALDPASAAEGRAVLRPVHDEEQAVVAIEPGPRLRILVESEGAPVARPWARVRFREGATLALRAEADGALSLPLSMPITLVRLGAPGHLSTILKPRDRSGAGAEGTLRLSLARGHRVTLRLRDETGSPALGAELRFSERRTGLRQHPDLGGAWPTAHPGWVERVDDDLAATTDADGTATATLAAGAHLVWVDVPAPLQIDIGNSATFTQAFEIEVERDDTFDCVVRGPRRVSLSVFDARSMAPVRGFTVLVPSGLSGASIEAPGHLWQGWVGATTDRLVVQASGFLGGEVELPPGSGVFAAEVLLSPTSATRICVTGDFEGLLGQTLEIQLLRVSGGEPEIVWQERRVLTDACLDIPVPFEDAWVRLDLSPSKTGLHCVPEQLQASAGRELVFEVRP